MKTWHHASSHCVHGLIASLLLSGMTLAANDAEPFEARVAPALSAKCVACHQAGNAKGGLDLSTRKGVLRGGDGGAGLVPGKPDESPVYSRAIPHDGRKPEMPEKGEPLTEHEATALRKWIEQGALWPEKLVLREKSKADASFWSLQPVKEVAPPEAVDAPQDWSRHPVDRFVWAKLRDKGLKPNPPADPRTFIRRATFDLWGLPPTPEEVAQFDRDCRESRGTADDPLPDAAVERLLDRLLKSPHYGERWARHWLDVAHYADTHGFERDQLRPNAWRYRDYVIESLNADKPYDQFIREQIAGDVIAPNDPLAVIATGFLAAGPWDFVGQVETKSDMLKRAARAGDLDDMVTQVITSTMGITINCARCHDHKLDPITQQEYYSLWSVFAGVKRGDRDVSEAEANRIADEKARITTTLAQTRSRIARLAGEGIELAKLIPENSGIDIRNGSVTKDRLSYFSDIRVNRLQTVESIPSVKWVFIPDGKGKVTVDLNVEVQGVPPTSGHFWDTVANRPLNQQRTTKLGETDFAAKGHTMLAMHANSGITFDLPKLREQCGLTAMRFSGLVGFGATETAAGTLADFTVFVDAEIKFQKLKLRKSETAAIDIEVPADAKTLTLMATDGGDGIGSDLLFIGDPKLVPEVSATRLTEADATELKQLRAEAHQLESDLKALREHAARWAEKVLPWLARECQQAKDEPNVGNVEPTRRELKLAAMFSDHMVLQREQPVPVWGWATSGDEVWVEFSGQKKTTRVAADGKWSVKLDPLKANAEPQDLRVNDRVIHDVVVGDVWLCAGQSNMAMTVNGKTAWLHVGGVANAAEVVRDSSNPLLRQFLVDWKTDTKPQANCTGKWTVAGPDTTAGFSATGYFFARELQQRLKVPIGILNASFGGSSVEGWTSREALARESDAEFAGKMDQLISDYENHEQLVADYVAALAKWETTHDRADPQGSSDDSAFAASDANTPDWRSVTIPASLEKLGLADGGVIWLRRDIEVPAEFGSAWRLDFPACQGFSTIYLNGTKFFDTTPQDDIRRPTRPVPPRSLAKPGKNTLTIKLHAQTGKSGITGGAFAIVPFNPKLATIPLAGEWLSKTEATFKPLPKDAAKMPSAPVKGTLHWMPVPSQYNAMLHPLIPYAMRGAAWYQGESNVGNPRYSKHLKILVNDWRQRWGMGDFPFYSCQLAGFGPRTIKPGDSDWAECREMQTAVLDLPNTGLANLIDTCEDGDLHPLNKQDAGRRLALVALANTYGLKDVASSGPVFDSLKIVDGKAIVTFKHVGDGLVARRLPATYHPNLRKLELEPKPLELPSPGSELQGFVICDASQNWVNAQAKIEGATVIVWSNAVKSPVAVRYAWANHPVCNLNNQAGLPAFPFRSDTFPSMSAKKNP